MTTGYQTLEYLLPQPMYRRDRFDIVEDTKVYIRQMEQKLSNLKTTREDYYAQLEAAGVANEGQQQGESDESEATEPGAADFALLAGSDVLDSKRFEDLNVEIVIDRKGEEHEVVIFVRCRLSSGGKVFSSLLRAIEKLQLDVSQCSTSKSSQFYFCNAVCKPQEHLVMTSLSREVMIEQTVTALRSTLSESD
eukprot:TRINITY_DN17331_c0_g1_i1.p1 TRINITY_DN17331_c0_g1~~TRINITY_DN17331_c0_g1_i1.p1  ORF type:complete len:193 (-),score=25.32 TRINITY_DN17331_c0_g1_i1:391-969(-)